MNSSPSACQCYTVMLPTVGCGRCLQAMRTYGYEIVQTLIVDVEPDETVKRAMNEINAGNVSFLDV